MTGLGVGAERRSESSCTHREQIADKSATIFLLYILKYSHIVGKEIRISCDWCQCGHLKIRFYVSVPFVRSCNPTERLVPYGSNLEAISVRDPTAGGPQLES